MRTSSVYQYRLWGNMVLCWSFHYFLFTFQLKERWKNEHFKKILVNSAQNICNFIQISVQICRSAEDTDWIISIQLELLDIILT